MVSLKRLGLLLGTLASTAVLAGCGSSGSSVFGSSQKNELKAYLTTAQNDYSDGNCNGAEAALNEFVSTLNNMSGVNQTAVHNLLQGAQSTLSYGDQCTDTTGTTSTGSETTTTGTGTGTSSTSSTSTHTNTQSTTTSQTTPTTPTTTTSSHTTSTVTPTSPSTPTSTSGGSGL